MGQAQINVMTRVYSRTFIARTKQAALTHHVRGKELSLFTDKLFFPHGFIQFIQNWYIFRFHVTCVIFMKNY